MKARIRSPVAVVALVAVVTPTSDLPNPASENAAHKTAMRWAAHWLRHAEFGHNELPADCRTILA